MAHMELAFLVPDHPHTVNRLSGPIAEAQEFLMSILSFSSAPDPAPKPAPATPAEAPADEGHAKGTPSWKKYGTPILVLLLALAVLFTITHNWNSWEGGHVEQVTDDA